MPTQDGCCQYPCPCSRSLPTHACTRDPQTLRGRSGSVSYGVTAPFPWVLVHTSFCLCPPWVFVSPSPVEVMWSNPTCLQSQTPWRFPVPLLDNQVGSSDAGPRTSSTVGELLWYYCSPVCGSSTRQVWNLILTWLRPSYHLIVAPPLSLDKGYIFLVDSNLLLLMVAQQLVEILVFSRRTWAHILLLHYLTQTSQRSQSCHGERTSTKLRAMPCRATQDGLDVMEASDKGDPLEKGMANHSSIPALRTPRTVWKGKNIWHRKMSPLRSVDVPIYYWGRVEK